MITHGILLVNVSSYPPQLQQTTFLFHKDWKQLLYFKCWYSCYSLHRFYNAVFNLNTTYFEKLSFLLTLFTIDTPVLFFLPLSNCMKLLNSNLYLLPFSCFYIPYPVLLLLSCLFLTSMTPCTL